MIIFSVFLPRNAIVAMEAFYEVSKEFPKKWLSMFWDILVSCYFNGPTTNEDMGGGEA